MKVIIFSSDAYSAMLHAQNARTRSQHSNTDLLHFASLKRPYQLVG